MDKVERLIDLEHLALPCAVLVYTGQTTYAAHKFAKISSVEHIVEFAFQLCMLHQLSSFLCTE